MFFGKTLYAVDDGRQVYYPDGTVGRKRFLGGNYTFIKVVKETPSCSKHKPTFAKYIIKITTDEGVKYCYSNHLTTPYIRLVLQTLFPNEKIFFVKISPNLGILFFDREYIITANDEKILREKVNSILQGLSYKEVDIDFIVKKISSIDTRKIFKYTALGLGGLTTTLLVLGGVYYYMTSSNEQKQEIQNTIAQAVVKPVEIIKQNELPYEKSVYFLNMLLTLPLGNYLFIKDVAFTNEAITLASFIPLPNFSQTGNMYTYTVVLEKKIEDALDKIHSQQSNYKLKIVLKNYPKCLSFLNKYPIKKTTSNYIVFEVRKMDNPMGVYKFLSRLASCPVNIQGTVSYIDLLHRRLDLTIHLYTPQYTLSLLK